MSDYRDRFEEQLLLASHRLSSAADEPAKRSTRGSRRAIYVSMVGLLCVGTAAVAATRPWKPLLGDPQYPESRATSTAGSPPASQLEILGVFRRSARDADRGPEVLQALKFLGSGTRGVKVRYIRRTVGLVGNGAAVLVPAQSWQPAQGEPKLRIEDAVCLVIPDPAATDSAAKSCWSEATIRQGEATASIGSAFYGIVPDGIETVVATFDRTSGLLGSRPTVNAAVVDNVFVLRAPADGAGPATAPLRPTLLEGLDAKGDPAIGLRP